MLHLCYVRKHIRALSALTSSTRVPSTEDCSSFESPIGSGASNISHIEVLPVLPDIGQTYQKLVTWLTFPNLTNFVPNPRLSKRKTMQKYDDRKRFCFSYFFRDFSISCSIECHKVAKSLVRKLLGRSYTEHAYRNEMTLVGLFWFDPFGSVLKKDTGAGNSRLVAEKTKISSEGLPLSVN